MADYRQSVWLLFGCGRVRFADRLCERCQSSTFPGVEAHARTSRAGRTRGGAPTGATTSHRERRACFRGWSSRGVVLTLESRWHHCIEPAEVPRFHETRIDFVALAFTAGVAAVAGMLIGLWPALRISRIGSLSLELHQGAGRAASEGLSRQRIRAFLVVAQMALALILLAAAGLTLKSFWHAQNAPLGFDPHGVLTMNLSLPKARYPDRRKLAALTRRYRTSQRATRRRRRRHRCEHSFR